MLPWPNDQHSRCYLDWISQENGISICVPISHGKVGDFAEEYGHNVFYKCIEALMDFDHFPHVPQSVCFGSFVLFKNKMV